MSLVRKKKAQQSRIWNTVLIFFFIFFLKKMSNPQSSQDIEMSSAPFEPYTNAKKRKTSHKKSFNSKPTSFEEELQTLNESLHHNIESKIKN